MGEDYDVIREEHTKEKPQPPWRMPCVVLRVAEDRI